jgi:hypothetical protein
MRKAEMRRSVLGKSESTLGMPHQATLDEMGPSGVNNGPNDHSNAAMGQGSLLSSSSNTSNVAGP